MLNNLFITQFYYRDTNRILLGKMFLNLFYPSLLCCLILTSLSIINRQKIKPTYLFINYIILFLFLFKMIHVTFFIEFKNLKFQSVYN